MKLYVGTYAKYNAGSIAGAWLDLDKYANADEFLAACRYLHRDERDPDFMFQDVETDPGCDWQEGLYSECSVPRDYWALRDAAESEKRREASRPKSADKVEQERLCAVYMAARGYDRRTERAAKRYDEQRDYYLKRNRFVELIDGTVLPIDKPSIQTRFCCGEDDRGQGGDGPGTMAYAHKVLEYYRTETGFKRTNIGDFDKEMVHLVGRRAWRLARDNGRGADTWRGDFVPCLMRGALADGSVYLGNAANAVRPETVVRILDDDDMRRLRRGYMAVRREYVRRVNAYWKRYGASKLHTWTYWTEA